MSPYPQHEASDTDAIGSPESDTMFGEESLSDQIARAGRRLNVFDYDDESHSPAAIETLQPDTMADESVSELIEQAARERLDSFDHDNEMVASSDENDRAPNPDDDADTTNAVETQDTDMEPEESMSETIERAAREAGPHLSEYDNDNHSEHNTDDDNNNDFSMESVHSDGMFGVFDMNMEKQSSKRHIDDDAAIQVQAMIEQQEREVGARARRRKEAEKTEKDDLEPMQELDAEQASQQTQQAHVAEKNTDSAEMAAQLLSTLDRTQRADTEVKQVNKARRTRPPIEQRRYLEQQEKEKEDELARSERMTVQWTRNRGIGEP
jgi:hypothetical protein